jgi:hypothetical protein
MHSRKLSFKSANSPFAERQRIADRKRLLPNPLRSFFLAEWYFITKLGPQVSLLYHFLVLTIGSCSDTLFCLIKMTYKVVPDIIKSYSGYNNILF